MAELFENAIVEKRNVLNELRSNNMRLQELRFFSIYLSKINPRDKSTRIVRFYMDDFKQIMGFGKLNINQLKDSTDRLLCKVVHIPNAAGGFDAFTLFKKCTVTKDENDEWYVEINASDDALPLMFDFKNRYFKYALWNCLRLKSPNQIRMYEILKQYESLGKRELEVTELRELLGMANDEYSGRTGWSNFKKYVLDSCQQALKENTDICYTYERGKTGPGGKWLSIIFNITKNNDFKDPLSLEKFIDLQPRYDDLTDEEIEELHLKELSKACNDEFSPKEIHMIFSKMEAFIPRKIQSAYLNGKYQEMLYRDERLKKKNSHIDNRFGYLKTIVEIDFIKYLDNSEDDEKPEGYEPAYDIKEYESHSIIDKEY